MKNWKKITLAVIVAVAFMFASVGELAARGGRSGGGGGFRSSGRSRSTTRSTRSTRSTRKAPSKKSASKARTKAAPKRTAAQQKSYEAAKKNGTAFKSKADATKAFKTKNAKQYTSKYAAKPATRPSHIPQTTSVNGKNVNVTYNVSHGGYGYMNPMGTWMMYDAMTDAIMLSALMSRNNYHYDTIAPVGHNGVHHRTSAFTYLGLALVAVVVILIFVAIFKRGV
jgi:hypothetical protein